MQDLKRSGQVRIRMDAWRMLYTDLDGDDSKLGQEKHGLKVGGRLPPDSGDTVGEV